MAVWMAAGVEAAKRANRAEAYRYREMKREEYNEYRGEQRACGYEVESFEEWLGEVSPREAAENGLSNQDDWEHFNAYGDD